MRDIQTKQPKKTLEKKVQEIPEVQSSVIEEKELQYHHEQISSFEIPFKIQLSLMNGTIEGGTRDLIDHKQQIIKLINQLNSFRQQDTREMTSCKGSSGLEVVHEEDGAAVMIGRR
jgi:hypothetical protein